MQSVDLYPTRFAKQNVTILSTKKGMMSLKRVSICALLTLMITLFAGTALQAWASEKAGYFDEMDGSVIVGWGWDSSSPNTAVPVHITVTRWRNRWKLYTDRRCLSRRSGSGWNRKWSPRFPNLNGLEQSPGRNL